ncbi:hypothetical protein FACS1894190_13860 [Spirochaetia bacterium]|nr:hypothetical protein FACS1894190_13860 [Spirochaetia bacterium]
MFLALPVGCLSAFVRFLLPDFVGDSADGFGAVRFANAFVDYAALPVIFPIIAAFIIGRVWNDLKIKDPTGWILIALIPVAAVRTSQWSALVMPLRLVLVPILWSACAVGIFPAAQLFKRKLVFKTLSVLITAGLLFLSSLIWFAFFCHENIYGAVMLLILLAYPITILAILFRRSLVFESHHV